VAISDRISEYERREALINQIRIQLHESSGTANAERAGRLECLLQEALEKAEPSGARKPGSK
jgi:hypothetical protein